MEKNNINTRHILRPFYKTILLIAIIHIFLFSGPIWAQELDSALTLPDLSGLAWIKGDLFLGIHDAKNNSTKHNWPRISKVQIPKSELQGVIWQPLDIIFPGPEERSSDLESACSIPGGKGFLFAESGQIGDPYKRIFYAEYNNDSLLIKSYIVWPVDVKNVEASEVCQVGDSLVFLYAERAEGRKSTKIRWANLSLEPFKIGSFNEVTYIGVDPVGKNSRPIVAMDIDSDGSIYIVSAYDTGNDNGPFRSVVWRIGSIISDEKGNPLVKLSNSERLANLDGLKVESIAVRELNGTRQIYFGTDDENYGGIIRLLP